MSQFKPLNEFCFKFILYIGKETDSEAGLTLSALIVVELLTCVDELKHHAVFFDNLFTNWDLLVHLGQYGFRATKSRSRKQN